MLGAGVYLLDSLRGRMSSAASGFEELRDRAQDTYDTASDRMGRAGRVLRGQDHPVIGTAAALLLGVGVGVGVGMLLAPASGEETRQNIADKVEGIRDKVRDRFKPEKETASGTYGG
jgi:hypothetical protein